ncbi:hypothetical protein [Aeromonas sp. MrichA-1]|uniref:hypothetical protein n=1 Tax=Aeromonas sp. MrichA-1 TaxID=2823362 RepID=UPI001B31A93B|nr:hypothetical protein [Aeromonas sp. MrichA-1]MBP4081815.1 hypothetical protein [Aeromonas sp. MrichA-1]
MPNIILEAEIEHGQMIWIESHADGRFPFFVDCGFCRGRKAISELPRTAKTLTAAKAIATRYLGYKPDWKTPAEQQE